jgi:hypothetical protein
MDDGFFPRRAFLGSSVAFAGYALLGEARAAAPGDRRLSARRWIDRQDELARGLASGSVTQARWRAEVARLARELDVSQLLAEIRRSRLDPAGAPFGKDPVKRFVRFLDEQGRPRRLAYGAATFTFSPDSVITPHAHRHMASAHLVIDGKVRVRTFDRLRDEAGALVVRPTGDHVARAGEASAMTTERDNVHWFAPRSPTATTFDVILSDLDPGQPSYEIQPVDVLGGRRLADGSIRAPVLSFAQSMERYSAAL